MFRLNLVRSLCSFFRAPAVSSRHRRRRFHEALEALESRELLTVANPAIPFSSSLAITPGGHSATFTDVDGDHVTVAVSAGALTDVNFVMDTTSNLHDQLQLLDLTTGGFGGASVTISVARAGGGDGLTNVGEINAAGFDLGAVKITGDLGRILAGDSHTSTSALTSLSVTSMGREGLDSQADGGSIDSNILGNVGSITVTKDIKDAHVNIETAGDGVAANLGTITVGGSLIGGAGDHSGHIDVDGNIGVAKISGDVVGGTGGTSGGIIAQGSLNSATIAGSVIGGYGSGSATVFSVHGVLGTLSIGGSVLGGRGDRSGYVGSYNSFVGKITIGGSLIGGAGESSGVIRAQLGEGATVIGGDVIGVTAVDGAIRSGTIASLTVGGDVDSIIESADAGIGAVKIGGSLLGGTLASDMGPLGDVTIGGSVNGSISSSSTIGKITIGGDLNAPIGAGGAITSLTVGGDVNARVSSGTLLGTTKISGDLLGTMSAPIMTAVSIAGSVTGATVDAGAVGAFVVSGKLDSSGQFNVTGSLGTFTVARTFGGNLSANSATSIKVGGNLTGDLYVKTNAGSITIGGSLVGATDPDTGHVGVAGVLGTIKVGGSLFGGAGANSGFIVAGAMGTATVGGSLVGGTEFHAGDILVRGSVNSITVAHNIRGGAGGDTGQIITQTANTIAVKGSIFGGGAVATGEVLTYNSVGSVTIGGSLVGGSNAGNGELALAGAVISYGHMGSVLIGGSIIAGMSSGSGVAELCGAVVADEDIGSLTVKGSLIGNDNGAGHVTTVVIAAEGPAVPSGTSDVAIGSVTIGGRMELANILGGYDASADAQNGDAQIGTVKIGGDFIASSIVAGVENIPSTNVNFGDGNDALIPGGADNITASIGSITIGGTVNGTPNSNSTSDHFGIVTQVVGAVKINGATVPLAAGPSNDDLALGSTGDVTLLEI